VGQFYDTVIFNQEGIDWGAPPSRITFGSWNENPPRRLTDSPPSMSVWNEDYAQSQRAEAAKQRVVKSLAGARVGEIRSSNAVWLRESGGREEVCRMLRDAVNAAERGPTSAFSAYFRAVGSAMRQQANAASQLARVPKGVAYPHAQYALGHFSTLVKQKRAAYLAASQFDGPRKIPALVMAARWRMTLALPPKSSGISSNLREARAAAKEFEQILKMPAAERFHWNARAWLARVDYAQRRYDLAAVAYARLLAQATRPIDEETATVSLRWSLQALTPVQAERFRNAILADQDALASYLNYRIHHFAREDDDYGLPSIPRPRLKPISEIAGLASKRYRTSMRPALRVALAELANLERNDAEVLRLLNAYPVKAKDADVAQYLVASAHARRGRTEIALQMLRGFEKRFPSSTYAKAVREYRAYLYLKGQQLPQALAEFEALKYRIDAAYILDVRMTSSEVKGLAERNPKRWDYRLALGYRHLRQSEFDAAIATFGSIPAATRRSLAMVDTQDYRWNADKSSPIDAVPDPLQTATDLREFEQQGRKATSDEDKAKTRYAQASYLYQRRNLLFYNASLWGGSRNFMLVNPNRDVMTSTDSKRIETHYFEHECLQHARRLCLDIVQDYPNTAIVPFAYYRAATSTRRLADFSPWWRQYGGKTMYEDAANLLKELYSKHPNHRLSKNARKYEPVYRMEGKQAANAARFAPMGPATRTPSNVATAPR
jgi:hypothetical protein